MNQPIPDTHPQPLRDIFSPGGLLSRVRAGTDQAELARAVDSSIREGTHLVADGSDDVLAWLAPAVRHAAETGSTVVIATNDVGLQERLLREDIPLLARMLPEPLSFALLEARDRYLCLDRARSDDTDLSGFEAETLDLLDRWARTTDTGRRSELEPEAPDELWRLISVSSEDCKGRACPAFAECFAHRAQDAARAARVVVCSLPVLFAHLKFREATGRDSLLPAFDVCILPDGEDTANAAREYFGFRLTSDSIRSAGRLLSELGAQDLQDELDSEAASLFRRLVRYARTDDYRVRMRRRHAVSAEDLLTLLARAARLYGSIAEGEPHHLAAVRAARRCTAIGQLISSAFQMLDRNAVVSIETCDGRGAMCGQPMSVAARMEAALYQRTRVVIALSSRPGAASLELMRDELGTPEAARTLVVQDEAAPEIRLVVPQMPEREHPGFRTAAAGRIVEASNRLPGRVVALCSPEVLEAASERLPVGSDVVLTSSLEDLDGIVDCLVLEQLPFPSPDDPILDMRRDRDRHWFRRYALPKAIVAFQELARSVREGGTLVVLDRRLVSRPYGSAFLTGLPRVRMSEDIDPAGQGA